MPSDRDYLNSGTITIHAWRRRDAVHQRNGGQVRALGRDRGTDQHSVEHDYIRSPFRQMLGAVDRDIPDERDRLVWKLLRLDMKLQREQTEQIVTDMVEVGLR